MPPRAIRSSVVRTISSGRGSGSGRSRCGAGGFPGGSADVLIEEEDEVDRLGELGPARVAGVEAEPAVFGVELLASARPVPRRPRPATAAACAGRPRPGAASAPPRSGRRPTCRSRPADPVQASATALTMVEEPRRPLAIARGEIGAAEEGPAVGRQEHRHRPAAGPERLERGHVDLVDVRAAPRGRP